MKVTFCSGLVVSAFTGFAAFAQGTVTSPDAWKDHLQDDLMPFWGHADAVGTPPGSFPRTRCNDGTAVTPGVACSGVSVGASTTDDQALVGQARQVFGYAVAFHMTGDTRYLDWAKEGAAYQIDTFYDASTGLFAEYYDAGTDTQLNVGQSSQKQAYGLLGLNFLYYLTEDATLGQQVSDIEDALSDRFRNDTNGSYAQTDTSSGPSPNIYDHLDQLNTYKVGLAGHGPLADRATHLAEARETVDYLRDAFFDSTTGLFKGNSTAADGDLANVDYGHNIKTLWFIDQVAELSGDAELAAFARSTAKTVFDMAWDPTSNHWEAFFDGAGDLSPLSVWWVSAEMNQYMAALAIDDPSLRARLELAQASWLSDLTDTTDGGTWVTYDRSTGLADTTLAKHSEWVNAFHSFEHALIQQMGAAAMSNTDLTLYFARDGGSDFGPSYGFTATGAQSVVMNGSGDTLQAVTFSGVDYGSASTAIVPLPATGGLLVVGGVVLAAVRRRRAVI